MHIGVKRKPGAKPSHPISSQPHSGKSPEDIAAFWRTMNTAVRNLNNHIPHQDRSHQQKNSQILLSGKSKP